jgi:hypothetical protein
MVKILQASAAIATSIRSDKMVAVRQAYHPQADNSFPVVRIPASRQPLHSPSNAEY